MNPMADKKIDWQNEALSVKKLRPIVAAGWNGHT
jgi:hypothetical protein